MIIANVTLSNVLQSDSGLTDAKWETFTAGRHCRFLIKA